MLPEFSIVEPKEEPEFSIMPPDMVFPTVSEPVASLRATKADIGLGPMSPGKDQLQASIVSGDENQARAVSADQETEKLRQEKMKMLLDHSKTPGSSAEAMLMLAQAPLSVNPDLVWEQKYAETVVNNAISLTPGYERIFGAAINNHPERLGHESDIAIQSATLREGLNRIREDIEARYSNEGILSTVGDHLLNMVPFVSWYRMHNVVKALPANSLLPGDNAREQISYIWRQPKEQAIRLAKTVLDDLYKRNPPDAVAFAKALVSFGSSAQMLGNTMGLVDISTVLPYGWIGRASGLATLEGRVLGPGVIGTHAGPARSMTAEELGLKGHPMTKNQIETARIGTNRLVAEERAGRIVDIPRAVTPSELAQMAERLGVTPGPSELTPAGVRRLRENMPELEATGNVTGFKTAKGSTYTLQKNGGTIRDKAPRPDHTDKGIQPASVKTFYATQEQVDALAIPQGKFNVVDHGNGTLSVATPNPFGGAMGIAPSQRNIPVSSTPQVGLIPIELWNPKKVMGTQVYSKVHYGNEITEITRRAGTNTEGRFLDRRELDALRERMVPRVLEPSEIEDMKTGLAHVVQFFGNEPKFEGFFAAMGDTHKAASVGAVSDLSKVVSQAPKTADDVYRNLPSIYNVPGFFDNPGSLAREARVRILNEAVPKAQVIQKALTTLPRVPRTTEPALLQAVQEAKDQVLKEIHYPNANNAVLDIVKMEHIPAEEYLTPLGRPNVDMLAVNLGKRDGSLFESRKIAEYYRDWHGLDPKDAEIIQQGDHFYLRILRPINETTDSVRGLMIDTTNTTPKSLANLLLGKIRSSEYLLSAFQSRNRNLATHVPQELRRILKEDVDIIASLPKQSRQDLRRVLEALHLEPNPVTKQEGWWPRDYFSWESFVTQTLGRTPTTKETSAYLAFVRLNDVDYIYRNLGVLRDKLRQGRMQFRADTPDAPWFEGRWEKNIAWESTDQENIVVYNARLKTWELIGKHDNAPAGGFATAKAYLDDLVKNQNYRVVRVASPIEKPLKDASGVNDIIHYVVTDGWKVKPLDMIQVEYREGGHRILSDMYYGKQARIAIGTGGRNYYWGDTTLFSASSRAEAIERAEKWDTARLMMNNNDPAVVAYVQRNLGMTYKDFQDMFGTGKYLDPLQPIQWTTSGKYVTETHSEHFSKAYPGRDSLRDYVQASSNLDAGIDKTYLADRSQMLYNRRNYGSEAMPLIVEERARMLDPYVSLNRGLGQIIRSTWMNDYKHGAVESWIQEFKHLLNITPGQADKNPYYHFYHPDYKTGVDREALAAAQNARFRALQFLGVDNELGRNVQWLEMKIMDGFYNSLGIKSTDWAQDKLLPWITDPTLFLRKAAFHMKLGLFNPVQLLVQSQMLVHALAVGDPKHAYQGFVGGVLSRYGLHTENPAVLDRLDSIATAIGGWKKGDWRAMHERMQSSGIANIGGESAWRQDFFDPKLFQSKMGTFLDKSAIFFNEGDRLPRLIANAIAYREWNARNPLTKIGDRQLGEIMNRANLLSGDMTRAANSALQEGIFAPMTQFMTFNQRMAEQFLGNRLTKAEKARALGIYSMLYGIPVAASIPLAVEPLYDDIRQMALERGVNVNDKWYRLATEGLVSIGVEAVTGKQTDVARRLSPGANSLLKDIRDGKKEVIELLLGASGSIFADTVKSAYPVLYGLSAALRGEPQDFPLKHSDWMDIARNAATLGVAEKVHAAVAYHKWISKNERNVSNTVDNMDAFLAVLGLTPQRIADVYLMQSSSAETRGESSGETLFNPFSPAQNFYKQQAFKELKRAHDPSASEKDYRDYSRRAAAWFAAGDFNLQDQAKIFQQAVRDGVVPADQRVPYDFATRGPASQLPARQERYREYYRNNFPVPTP